MRAERTDTSPRRPLAKMGSLFVDKHRPKTLSSLSYHSELSARLEALVRNLCSLRQLLLEAVSGTLTFSSFFPHRRRAIFLTPSSMVHREQGRRRASWQR